MTSLQDRSGWQSNSNLTYMLTEGRRRKSLEQSMGQGGHGITRKGCRYQQEQAVQFWPLPWVPHWPPLALNKEQRWAGFLCPTSRFLFKRASSMWHCYWWMPAAGQAGPRQIFNFLCPLQFVINRLQGGVTSLFSTPTPDHLLKKLPRNRYKLQHCTFNRLSLRGSYSHKKQLWLLKTAV